MNRIWTRLAKVAAGVIGMVSAMLVANPVSADSPGVSIAVGVDPRGVAIDPTGAYAYVVNSGANSVSKIATATNSVVATIPVGAGPSGIAITPDGTYAFVTNVSAGTVSRITLATSAVAAPVTVGTSPNGIAITPNGAYAYVANSGSHTVMRINVATNTVVAPALGVSDTPFGIAMNGAGTFAYVSRNSISGFARLDTSSLAGGVGYAGNNPFGVAAAADDSFVLFANPTAGTITRVNPSTGATQATIPVGSGPRHVVISPDGLFAYVTNYSSATISKIDLGINSVVETISVGANPFGISLSPDGSFGFVANYGSDTVTRFTSTRPAPPVTTPARSAQLAASNCVVKPRALSKNGSKRVAKTRCTTSAGNKVGARLAPGSKFRGKVKLRCVLNGRVLGAPTNIGAGYRYCNRGALQVITSGVQGRVILRWRSAETATHFAFDEVRTYRVRG